MAFLAQVLTVAAKDVRAELRSRDAVSGSVVFALLVLVIFNFAFDLEGEMSEVAGPGVLWVAIALAGMMGLGHVFAKEREQGGLQGLLLTPMDRSAIFVGKVAAALLLTFALELFLLPLFAVFADVSILSLELLLVVMLGTVGFVTVGTLFSAIAVHTRAREVMLPILLFPIVVPLMIAAVKITGGLLDGQPLSEMRNWMNLLVGFDVIFLTVSYMTFDYVVEE